MTTTDVLRQLRIACDKAGSARGWAIQNKVSAPYVSDVLRGRREPGDAILGPLGLERVISYRRVNGRVK